MTTKHLTDSAHLDGTELEARHALARTTDLELSERLGRELCLELGLEVA